MNILIFGRGVIASQYAYYFEKAGHQVTFYVRRDVGNFIELDLLDARKKALGKKIKDRWEIKTIRELPAAQQYDVVMVSVQHYQLKDVLEYLKPRIGNSTLFICNNFWDEPAEVVKDFPSAQVVWGFPRAGGGFDKDDVLKGAVLNNFFLGTLGQEDYNERTKAVQQLLISAGFKTDMKKDFRSWLFIHFAMNASLHTESERHGSAIKALSTYNTFRVVRKNAREILPLLRARGVDVDHGTNELKLLLMPAWMLYATLGLLTKIYPPLNAILSGHSNFTELVAYRKDVLATARKLNIQLPSFNL